MAPSAAFGTNMNKNDIFKSCCSAQQAIIWGLEWRHLPTCAIDYEGKGVRRRLH